MAGTIIVPSLTGWQQLMQRVGVRRGPRRRSPLAIPATAPTVHAEVFMSERTGEWIRVGCDCQLGYDHWHTNH